MMSNHSIGNKKVELRLIKSLNKQWGMMSDIILKQEKFLKWFLSCMNPKYYIQSY